MVRLRSADIARSRIPAGTLAVMNPTEFRLELLAALEENGRETTDGLIALVGAEEKGLDSRRPRPRWTGYWKLTSSSGRPAARTTCGGSGPAAATTLLQRASSRSQASRRIKPPTRQSLRVRRVPPRG